MTLINNKKNNYMTELIDVYAMHFKNTHQLLERWKRLY